MGPVEAERAYQEMKAQGLDDLPFDNPAKLMEYLSDLGLENLDADETNDDGITVEYISNSNVGSDYSKRFNKRNMQRQILSQIKQLFGREDTSFDWDATQRMALSRLHPRTTNSRPGSNTDPQYFKEKLTIADLWIDGVTSLTPVSTRREIWSEAQWIKNTMPVWQTLSEPVVQNLTRAMGEAIAEQLRRQGIDTENLQASAAIPGLGNLFGPMQPVKMVQNLVNGLLVLQIGQALARIAHLTFGSTDLAIPLTEEPVMALVIRNVDDFVLDQDIALDAARQYLAVREAACARLFNSVPWLRHRLSVLVQRYASEIALDVDAIEQTARDLQDQMREHLEEHHPGEDGLPIMGGFGIPIGGIGNQGDSFSSFDVFKATPTPSQVRALEDLQTLLALIEGWVDEVSTQACLPNLNEVMKLRELMRRRRVTDLPIEKTLKTLFGMDLSPKYSRQAANLWMLLYQEEGIEGRDRLWSHPDLMPRLNALNAPQEFIAQRKQPQTDQIDQELDSLLSGTLGWAKGLDPKQDSEGDLLANQSTDTSSADSELPGKQDSATSDKADLPDFQASEALNSSECPDPKRPKPEDQQDQGGYADGHNDPDSNA